MDLLFTGVHCPTFLGWKFHSSLLWQLILCCLICPILSYNSKPWCSGEPCNKMVLSSQGSSLATIYKSFVQQVAALQKFWEVLDEVDHKCWVMDPDNPTRKDTYRRIMIGMVLSPWLIIYRLITEDLLCNHCISIIKSSSSSPLIYVSSLL